MTFAEQLPNGFYLALVYLVISGNYLGNLFGCRVQQIFRESMWVKHILGFFTTYFLIILSTPPENYGSLETLGLTGAIYFWFFLTTKMHVKLWLPMILAVLLAYTLYVYKKQNAAAAAKTATDTTAEKKDTNTDVADRIESIQTVSVLFAAVLTVLGVMAYYGEKRLEYGDQFDAWTFWTGVPECRFATPPVSITTSLMAAVGIKN